MRKVASLLIDIHGQHEHESLLAKRNHMKYLDAWKKKAAIWGASHQGFTLAATTSLGKKADISLIPLPLNRENLLRPPIFPS